MRKLRVNNQSNGLHPTEVLVEITTSGGIVEEMVIDRSQVADNAVEVWQVEKNGSSSLVELPRETTRGKWRVWVNSTNFVEA